MVSRGPGILINPHILESRMSFMSFGFFIRTGIAHQFNLEILARQRISYAKRNKYMINKPHIYIYIAIRFLQHANINRIVDWNIYIYIYIYMDNLQLVIFSFCPTGRFSEIRM